MTIEEKLKNYSSEIDLRVLYNQAKDEEDKKTIKERIKEVTKNFIKCKKCGRSYGTLVKEITLKNGECEYTGDYIHLNCEKDTNKTLNNYVRKFYNL